MLISRLVVITLILMAKNREQSQSKLTCSKMGGAIKLCSMVAKIVTALDNQVNRERFVRRSVCCAVLGGLPSCLVMASSRVQVESVIAFGCDWFSYVFAMFLVGGGTFEKSS